jgi:pimeloyl-ACP methyl ester carboxylesterase
MNNLLTRIARSSFIIVLLFTSIAAGPLPSPIKQDTEILLQTLGGFQCFEDSIFTCVTIDVPLDHFNPSDTRTISVTFAVLPASGVRKGMFVTATGGPGYSGIASADSYTEAFDSSIPEAFDIVFFDQRGIAYSGGQTCPNAGNVYYQQDARAITPAQEAALKQTAKTFSTDCVNEVSNLELLPYLGTNQAVEDLEFFRKLVGDETFWLYGESYGTQFSQTYAAEHSDHLAGLLLDGTVDLTLDGIEFYSQQAQAFSDTLVASLSACNDDPACRKDMLGNAVKAYDQIESKLSRKSISFKFPLPAGGFDNRKFSLSNLEFVAASQMYNESDRMMFTRALAAFTSKQDMTPLARLLYLDLGVDPQTLDVIPDPYYSDAVFYGVECQDYGYPGNSPEKKANNYLKAADPFETSIPYLASILYGDLPCAYWPFATSDLTRPNYLFAENVPTIVLGATADPATPVGNGISVYQHLANAFLVTQEGGPHVIFGRGNECPDALVTDFLVNDVLPAERETACAGYVADDHVPLTPRSASEFKNAYRALSAIETEIYYLPEYYYWGGEPESIGCTYGGTLSFSYNNPGTKTEFALNKCALINNFILTGTGSYNSNNDRYVLDVGTRGRWTCDLKYVRKGEAINLSGKCDGKTMNENHAEQNYNPRRIYNFHRPKTGN